MTIGQRCFQKRNYLLYGIRIVKFNLLCHKWIKSTDIYNLHWNDTSWNKDIINNICFTKWKGSVPHRRALPDFSD